MTETETETAAPAPTTLLERVIAAKVSAEASFAAQVQNGTPLSEGQQAEILIAQVQAIIAGETMKLEPES